MTPANVRLNPVGMVVCALGLIFIAFYIFGLPQWFSRTDERVSMREVLSVSIALAKRGGTQVKTIAESHKLNVVAKGDTDVGKKELKTKGDMESHRAMVYGFAKMFPGLKVISEEHGTEPINLNAVEAVDKELEEVKHIVESDQSISMKDITIWIDPLDATQEYTENLPEYVTTMVCVAVKGEPVIGVIHKPFSDETAWAWVGYGHSSNLKKAEEKKDIDKKTKIIVSRSHPGPVKEHLLTALGKDTDIIEAGGAGYKTLEVIKGNADAYVHVTAIKKWDICAGNAILSALEGKMTTLDEYTIDYSPEGSVKNTKGLLATIYNHSNFLDKLKDIMTKTNS